MRRLKNMTTQEVLLRTNDFPIRHEGNVHDGKVRSVYWLLTTDSRRLIEKRDYDIDQEHEVRSPCSQYDTRARTA